MPPVPPEHDAFTNTNVSESTNKLPSYDSISTNNNKITKLTDDFIQVDDKVYSTLQLAQSHPGGELFVKAFAGRDATEAFLSYHRRQFPHARANVNEALIGGINANKDINADADFLELCQIIEQIVPRAKSFAPLRYYLKVAFILSVTFSLEVYMHTTGNYKWYITAVLGFFMALIGLNIQHDANHGAISRLPAVNRILGLTQNWIGGSSIDWIHQHVVQHHIHCNDVQHDPDIKGSDILRLNPLTPLLTIQAGQHLYFFALICIFGYIMIVSSLWHVVEGLQVTPYSKFLFPHRIFETMSSTVFILRWFVLPLYIQPSVYTLLNIAPMFIVGGFYLAFFFIISHNFTDVYMFDTKSAAAKDDQNDKRLQSFIYRQVTSSCNVGGAWLAFVNGGLNYQIEHHLFPRMSHCYYPTIAPHVKAFCQRKNIPYVHFPTITENMAACVAHLFSLGHNQKPVEINRKALTTAPAAAVSIKQ